MTIINKIILIYHGLSFFKKSFQGWWVVASYHHPNSITWRWSLSFDGRYSKEIYFPKFGPSYYMGKKFFAPNGYFGCWLAIPFLGTFSFSTQQHMWRNPNETDAR